MNSRANQPPYAYILEQTWPGSGHQDAFTVFTWPNACRKYIRDTYTTDGELHLPPAGLLTLTRVKVNPKAGQRVIADGMNIEAFLSA
jgi:hypothetical protein